MYHSTIKAIYDKLTAYSVVKSESFSSKISNKTRMLTLITSMGVLATAVSQEKE